MNKLKVKLEDEIYDVLQISFLPSYINPWEEAHGETAYIEYGINYKLYGQLYTSIEHLDFTKEIILTWDEECNSI